MKRATIGLVAYGAAGLCLALGIALASSVSPVDHTIENSRKIEAAFHSGAEFANAVMASTGRPPTRKQFEAWANSQPKGIYSPADLLLMDRNFPPEVIQQFGVPPPNAYVLSLWRGEWDEYFAGWSAESTLTFDRSAYSLLCSPLADLVAFAVLAFFTAFLGRRLRRAAV
jgi:hypothetical protein